MPIFQTNLHSLKHKVLSCIYFLFFCKNTPAVMLIFGQESGKSAKTTLCHGSKKSTKCLFFSEFKKKKPFSRDHIVFKTRQLSKKHNALMPIFYRKIFILTKKHKTFIQKVKPPPSPSACSWSLFRDFPTHKIIFW